MSRYAHATIHSPMTVLAVNLSKGQLAIINL